RAGSFAAVGFSVGGRQSDFYASGHADGHAAGTHQRRVHRHGKGRAPSFGKRRPSFRHGRFHFEGRAAAFGQPSSADRCGARGKSSADFGNRPAFEDGFGRRRGQKRPGLFFSAGRNVFAFGRSRRAHRRRNQGP